MIYAPAVMMLVNELELTLKEICHSSIFNLQAHFFPIDGV
jgi:hypothetical protein